MSSTGAGHSSPSRATEIRLAPESIEALACHLAQLLAAESPAPEAARARKKMLSAAEVAELFSVSRRWVYDNAEALGARRLGSGRRPRLRFDPDEVAERIDGLASRPAAPGSAAMRGDCRTDSLPGRRRAIVVGQARRRPGRRGNAPRPGAERAGATERLIPRGPLVAPAARSPEGQEAGDGR
ncbi:MAG: hypothetical protein ACTHLH_01540 [Solirubrobacterales bacterium]